jgi:hypothetical protein
VDDLIFGRELEGLLNVLFEQCGGSGMFIPDPGS